MRKLMSERTPITSADFAVTAELGPGVCPVIDAFRTRLGECLHVSPHVIYPTDNLMSDFGALLPSQWDALGLIMSLERATFRQVESRDSDDLGDFRGKTLGEWLREFLSCSKPDKTIADDLP